MVSSRAMTRCECAEVEFADVARQMAAGASLEDVSRETGCGRMCTGCIPDLEDYLRAVFGPREVLQ